MKTLLIAASALLLGGAALLFAQNTRTSNVSPQGRGRGGAAFAWNDRDKDGICDLTGAPVGQGRGSGAMRGAGRGRGANGGWGRGANGGWGRGMGRRASCPWMNQTPATK
jgi:hypothetical protein